MTEYLARRDSNLGSVLDAWLQRRTANLGTELPRSTDSPSPLTYEDRERAYQNRPKAHVLAGLRKALRSRYNARCMITGCPVDVVLDAHHVRPYLRSADNHPANGILLRTDLGILIELDLIGINPDNLKVVVHSQLLGTEYEQLAGSPLQSNGNKTIDMRAVKARWQKFMKNCPVRDQGTKGNGSAE